MPALRFAVQPPQLEERKAFMKRAAFLLGILALVVTPVAGRTGEPAPPSSPTFSKDVAPILFSRCVQCHRPGEIGPMSLLSYQDVRPWAKAIRSKVVAREMPPWGADPQYGRFRNDPTLSQAQIETIVAWVEAGAPKGNDADMPSAPSFSAGWLHGDPDLVLEMPIEFQVPAEGQVDVTNLYMKVPFNEDVFIKALEIRPTAPGVVHHG